METVGFIGLGIMGSPMAGHLIANGYPLFVHTRSSVPDDLVKQGATVCASGAEVARKSDIIITMLPDTPDVELVLFGAGGFCAKCSRRAFYSPAFDGSAFPKPGRRP